jgi:hypothetical protein
MKVGEDDWCPHCDDWHAFDENGNCKKCGTFINNKVKEHSWFEIYGIDIKEITPNQEQW